MVIIFWASRHALTNNSRKQPEYIYKEEIFLIFRMTTLAQQTIYRNDSTSQPTILGDTARAAAARSETGSPLDTGWQQKAQKPLSNDSSGRPVTRRQSHVGRNYSNAHAFEDSPLDWKPNEICPITTAPMVRRT